MFFALYDSSGSYVQSGFADENGYTFKGLNPTAMYYVYPADCDSCHNSDHDVVFGHWGDGSNTRPLEVPTGSSVNAWFVYVPLTETTTATVESTTYVSSATSSTSYYTSSSSFSSSSSSVFASMTSTVIGSSISASSTTTITSSSTDPISSSTDTTRITTTTTTTTSETVSTSTSAVETSTSSSTSQTMSSDFAPSLIGIGILAILAQASFARKAWLYLGHQYRHLKNLQ